MIFPLWLDDSTAFPNPQTAHPNGLLAMGGDLAIERLLAAYRAGIFPWFGPEDPILWWSPDPRGILFPHEFHLARSLLRRVRKGNCVIRLDSAFAEVVRLCADIPRDGENGTWILPEMITAYTALHKEGFAHSVEVWLHPEAARGNGPCATAASVPTARDENGYTLAGGCYGVEIGSIFCAESMFSLARDASKIALAALVCLARQRTALQADAISAIDCQFLTAHLASLGAREISRRHYLDLLAKNAAHSARASGGAARDWHRFQALFENKGWPDRLARIL